MKHVVITSPRLMSLPALSRLVAHAVQTHFTYFPLAIQRQVIRNHSLPKLLLAKLDRRRVVLTAYVDGRLAGYAIGIVLPNRTAHLFWLYVHPDHRGANIGLTLLSRMLKTLAQRGATEMRVSTYDHRRYYERQGFKLLDSAIVDGVPMDNLTFTLTPTHLP